jgi:hypothetical protein
MGYFKYDGAVDSIVVYYPRVGDVYFYPPSPVGLALCWLDSHLANGETLNIKKYLILLWEKEIKELKYVR